MKGVIMKLHYREMLQGVMLTLIAASVLGHCCSSERHPNETGHHKHLLVLLRQLKHLQ